MTTSEATKIGKRGAMASPLERYTPERKAGFLLSNAVNAEDYAAAVEEVQKLGLNPEEIPHRRHPTEGR